jgi:osmotically inducible protein OsmC
MAVRNANAEWRGNLNEGSGKMRFGSGAYEGAFSFQSRMGDGSGGTNPEELVGAALAGCFSMALSANLAGAGFTPTSVRTAAQVHFDKKEAGWTIHTIELDTDAKVPNISDDEFQKRAGEVKKACPVSRALTGVGIKLNAKLV